MNQSKKGEKKFKHCGCCGARGFKVDTCGRYSRYIRGNRKSYPRTIHGHMCQRADSQCGPWRVNSVPPSSASPMPTTVLQIMALPAPAMGAASASVPFYGYAVPLLLPPPMPTTTRKVFHCHCCGRAGVNQRSCGTEGHPCPGVVSCNRRLIENF